MTLRERYLKQVEENYPNMSEIERDMFEYVWDHPIRAKFYSWYLKLILLLYGI